MYAWIPVRPSVRPSVCPSFCQKRREKANRSILKTYRLVLFEHHTLHFGCNLNLDMHPGKVLAIPPRFLRIFWYPCAVFFSERALNTWLNLGSGSGYRIFIKPFSDKLDVRWPDIINWARILMKSCCMEFFFNFSFAPLPDVCGMQKK